MKKIKENYGGAKSGYNVQVQFVWLTVGSDQNIQDIAWHNLDVDSLVVMMNSSTNFIL